MEESKMINNKISKSFYVLKAIAIICVAAAHCPSFFYPPAEVIRALMGTLGVPCFMILSGFFFNRDEDKKIFWEKKIKAIIIPWIIWGIITFVIYAILEKQEINIIPLLLWIIGYKTWLYYVPVLLCCFILFRIVKHKAWDYFIMSIFLVSWGLTYFKVIGVEKYITNYQNPFNFIGFFLMGMIIRRTGKINDILCSKNYFKISVSFLWIVFGIMYAVFGKEIGYWMSLFSIPFEILSFFVFAWISYILSNFRLLENIGKQTYFIYFLHMQIGYMFINAIFKRLPFSNGIFDCVNVFIKPVLVVLFTYLLWLLARQISEKLKINNVTKFLSI